MKLFLIKSFLYLAIVLSIGFVMTYAYMKANPLKLYSNQMENMIFDYQHKVVKNKIGFRNIILGDSRTLSGFNSKIINNNLLNISMPSSSPIEGYLFLKKILMHNVIDTLIFSYAPNRFIAHESIKLSIYNNFFEDNDLENLDKLEKKYDLNIQNGKYNFFTPIERKMIAHKNLLIIRGIVVDSRRTVQGFKGNDVLKEIKNDFGFSVLYKRDSSNAISHDDLYYKNSITSKLNPVILSYVDSIYATCIKNNIQLAFVEFPVNHSTYNNLSKTEYLKFLQNFKILFKSRYPKMYYFDKFKELPNSYFGDENHLNINGSNYLSTEFRKEYFKH